MSQTRSPLELFDLLDSASKQHEKIQNPEDLQNKDYDEVFKLMNTIAQSMFEALESRKNKDKKIVIAGDDTTDYIINVLRYILNIQINYYKNVAGLSKEQIHQKLERWFQYLDRLPSVLSKEGYYFTYLSIALSFLKKNYLTTGELVTPSEPTKTAKIAIDKVTADLQNELESTREKRKEICEAQLKVLDDRIAAGDQSKDTKIKRDILAEIHQPLADTKLNAAQAIAQTDRIIQQQKKALLREPTVGKRIIQWLTNLFPSKSKPKPHFFAVIQGIKVKTGKSPSVKKPTK